VSEDQQKGANINREEGEDVEGHAHKNVNLEPSEVNLATDEDDDDVEGHMNKNAVNLGMHKNRNDEDDDDVEGHMHKNAVNLGMHKN
jgi:hypothetical protein